MEHWYVYYKLNPDECSVWLPRAPQLLARVHAATGVFGRLLQRADEAQGMTTLMEVYAGIDDPALFRAALQDALHETELPFDAGLRRTERFRDAVAVPPANA